jgi:hypothetical protein
MPHLSDTRAFTVKTLRIRNLQYLLSLSEPVKMIDNMKGSRLLKNMSILCKLRVRNFYSTGPCYLFYMHTWNTKGGSITVPLTSCLTALESAV